MVNPNKIEQFYADVATLQQLRNDLASTTEAVFNLAMRHEGLSSALTIADGLVNLSYFLDELTED